MPHPGLCVAFPLPGAGGFEGLLPRCCFWHELRRSAAQATRTTTRSAAGREERQREARPGAKNDSTKRGPAAADLLGCPLPEACVVSLLRDGAVAPPEGRPPPGDLLPEDADGPRTDAWIASRLTGKVLDQDDIARNGERSTAMDASHPDSPSPG